jgi:hypothetical protein
MTEEAIVLRRAGEAGFSASPPPHDFRRTFAANLIEANIDLVTVRDLMGHSDINTTAGYDRHSEDAKRRSTGKAPRSSFGPVPARHLDTITALPLRFSVPQQQLEPLDG